MYKKNEYDDLIQPRSYRFYAVVLGCAIALAISASAGASVAAFPPTVAEGRLTFDRVGYGTFRYARLFDVYAAALYLPRTKSAVLAPKSRTAKRLDLRYLRDVSRARIVAAAEQVLAGQLSDKAYAQLVPELNRWHERFDDAAQGDRFSMIFDGSVLTMRHNGRSIAQSDSLALAEAYFGIWLGDAAISEGLRAQLLNKTPVTTQPDP